MGSSGILRVRRPFPSMKGPARPALNRARSILSRFGRVKCAERPGSGVRRPSASSGETTMHLSPQRACRHAPNRRHARVDVDAAPCPSDLRGVLGVLVDTGARPHGQIRGRMSSVKRNTQVTEFNEQVLPSEKLTRFKNHYCGRPNSAWKNTRLLNGIAALRRGRWRR